MGGATARRLKQTAVYWPETAIPDRFGRHTYATGVEIKCRWQDKTMQFKKPDGEVAVSNAVILTLDSRVTGVGGYLFLGKLTDIVGNETKPIEAGAKRIEQRRASPNLRNNETQITLIV